jgi:hypothetical protein
VETQPELYPPGTIIFLRPFKQAVAKTKDWDAVYINNAGVGRGAGVRWRVRMGACMLAGPIASGCAVGADTMCAGGWRAAAAVAEALARAVSSTVINARCRRADC